MIKLENINVCIKNNKIIKNINLNFKKGKFTSIVGPNGCGKSTLIKTIANLIDYQGDISIDNKKQEEYKRKELAQKIAFLMQFSSIVEGLSVKDLIMYGRYPYVKRFKNYTKEDEEIVEWAMEKTDVTKFKDRLVSTLSGGEKQRVHLAMTLAVQPDYLFLDEPTNHLDVKYQYELLDLVKKLNLEENITIICVLHDINQAMRYSDEIFLLNKGEIYSQGTVEECINEENIKKVFDINCEINIRNNRCYLDII